MFPVNQVIEIWLTGRVHLTKEVHSMLIKVKRLPASLLFDMAHLPLTILFQNKI